jgi:hypothetical protein
MKNKLPNDIFEAMKNAKEKSYISGFDNTFTKTDFTPKKKPTIKEKLKNIINKFFNKVKKNKITLTIKNWFYNKVIKPYQTKKAEREHKKYIKDLQNNFSKKFNVDVEKTIKIMNGPGYSPHKYDTDELLVKNRIEMNKTKDILGNRMSPFLYEPDIIDIHNENLNINEGNPTFQELVKIENDKASSSAFKQYEFFRKRPHLSVSGRKDKRR